MIETVPGFWTIPEQFMRAFLEAGNKPREFRNPYELAFINPKTVEDYLIYDKFRDFWYHLRMGLLPTRDS